MNKLEKELLKVCRKHDASYHSLQNAMKGVRRELQKESFYEKPKRGKKLPALPSLEQVKKFVAEIDRLDNFTYKLWFYISLTTGIRVSEMVHLMVRDVNLGERKIFIRNGKGSKDRIVLLLPEVAELLKAYLQVNRKNIFLFENKGKPYSSRMVQLVFKKCKDRAGIESNVNPHSWRHVFLTALTEAGWNEAAIMKISGHSDKNSLLIYQHLAVDNLREDFEKVAGEQFRRVIA